MSAGLEYGASRSRRRDASHRRAEFVAESPKKSKAKKPATKPDIEGPIDQD